jgi:hypothetical protein
MLHRSHWETTNYRYFFRENKIFALPFSPSVLFIILSSSTVADIGEELAEILTPILSSGLTVRTEFSVDLLY